MDNAKIIQEHINKIYESATAPAASIKYSKVSVPNSPDKVYYDTGNEVVSFPSKAKVAASKSASAEALSSTLEKVKDICTKPFCYVIIMYMILFLSLLAVPPPFLYTETYCPTKSNIVQRAKKGACAAVALVMALGFAALGFSLYRKLYKNV